MVTQVRKYATRKDKGIARPAVNGYGSKLLFGTGCRRHPDCFTCPDTPDCQATDEDIRSK
jgi:hypothetical protein